MTRPQSLLATGLIALAGYVDAVGFLKLGGTFVSFMSGNSTRFAAGLGAADFGRTAELVGVITLFIAGVAAGHILRTRSQGREQPAVLVLVAGLLTVSGACNDLGWLAPAIGAATMAMGAENATFEKRAGVSVGLTYVSGTLVKIGDQLAEAVTGGPAFGWVHPLTQWGGFVAGGILGGVAFHAVGFDAIWFGAAFAGLFAVWALLTRARG